MTSKSSHGMLPWVSKETLVPVGLLFFIAGGVWTAAWSYFDISSRLHSVEVQISQNRWTYYEMAEAFDQIKTRNPSMNIPDYQLIHKKYHPLDP